MSSTKPEKARSKSGRTKLALKKETLRDLTARDAAVLRGKAGDRSKWVTTEPQPCF